MESGLYLYCIRLRTRINSVRGKEQNGPRILGKGINGKGKLFTVPYQSIEAVASQVSLGEFGSEEIQRKAQEDLDWIKEKAQAHEVVIEKAMRKGKRKILPVVPMKFGTIFKTQGKLEETLKKHYSQFKKDLDYLTGKQEWSVKIYLNRKDFEKDLKKASAAIQKKEKEISLLSEGMAYFRQRQIDEAVSKEADIALGKHTENFFESLKRLAENGVKGKILEKELTRKSLPMVLNAIFLVSEKNLEDFTKEINNLNKEFKTKGFTFEYSGPWPPYHFV